MNNETVIGLMDSAYFVPKNELLKWVNDTLQLDITYIEDLGSANGVWREGVKIQKEKVRDNDEFMISEEVLKFVFR
mgnify:CR=1 FL=1